MIDAVVVPVAIPVIASIQPPTRTGITWIDIPVWTVWKSVSNAVANVVADVHAVANIDVCVVPNARSIAAYARSVATDTRSVHNVVVDIVDVVA